LLTNLAADSRGIRFIPTWEIFVRATEGSLAGISALTTIQSIPEYITLQSWRSLVFCAFSAEPGGEDDVFVFMCEVLDRCFGRNISCSFAVHVRVV